MRSLVLAALAVAVAVPFAAAQTVTSQTVRATTTDGREVLLHSDGTWTEIDGDIELDLRDIPPPAPPPPAPPPPASFRGPPPAPAGPRTVESASGAYALRYDASRWRPSPQPFNAEAEFSFLLPFGAGYGITIYEVVPATSKEMRAAVLLNAEEALGRPPVVVREERVAADGLDGIRVEYRALMENGVDITFITTVFGSPTGSLQVVTWAGTAVVERYRDELVRFHDGVSFPAAGKP